MNRTSKIRAILERMASIERMERGKVCRMTGRSHYNHQTWHNGRNVVRYVRADRVDALREAIEGYRLFKKLAEQHADEIIRRTRAQSPSVAARRQRRTKGGRPRRL